MIPELRTSPRFAIVMSVMALVAIAVAAIAGHHLRDGLNSETAATVALVLWCLIGAGAAIAGIVDAYVRPEGERLGLATTIAATAFALLGLAILAGIVLGVTGLDLSSADEARSG